MANEEQAAAAERHYFPADVAAITAELGSEKMRQLLQQMLLIRNFEVRAESAYLHGKVGGFFHSYIGQEAIQLAALTALGPQNWYITSYRCHALALLLGATPNELMAELYGRATGNAKGRGGSMHFYTERLLGGFGIVTGQVPIATGAAFSLKYQNKKDEVAICFFGDGAVAQGALHEALNIASLWSLPCIYVIENNQWGMGTPISKAVCVKRLAEDIAPSYNICGYSFNGMDFFSCYAGFSHVYQQVCQSGRPVLIEAVTQRFRGHSVSDPGLYRTKEQLKEAMESDPLALLQKVLVDAGIIDMEQYALLDKQQKEIVIAAMQFAEQSPWPDPIELEDDVFAP